MDYSRWSVPSSIAFSASGKYLVELPKDFPVRLFRYSFKLPHPAIPNYHDFLEITYIQQGQGSFTIGGKEYPAEKGDVFVLNSGVFHLLESRTEDTETRSLYFMRELVHQPGMGYQDLDYLLLFLNYRNDVIPKITLGSAARSSFLRLIERVRKELAAKKSFYRIAVKNCLCEILLLLNRASRDPADEPSEVLLQLHDVNRLKPVFDYIGQYYSQKFKLHDIAKQAGLSTAYLSRYFKKVTGKTLTEYIKRFRIDKAKELLIEDERSITWIAYEVGFESHSYFDRTFHELTQLTPQEFRKKFQPKVRVAPDDATPAGGSPKPRPADFAEGAPVPDRVSRQSGRHRKSLPKVGRLRPARP